MNFAMLASNNANGNAAKTMTPKKPASPRRQSAGRGERSYAASMEAMAPPAVTPATLGDDKMRLSELKAQLKAINKSIK